MHWFFLYSYIYLSYILKYYYFKHELFLSFNHLLFQVCFLWTWCDCNKVPALTAIFCFSQEKLTSEADPAICAFEKSSERVEKPSEDLECFANETCLPIYSTKIIFSIFLIRNVFSFLPIWGTPHIRAQAIATYNVAPYFNTTGTGRCYICTNFLDSSPKQNSLISRSWNL